MNPVPDLDSIAAAAVRDVLGIGFRLHLVAESLDEIRESPSDAIWLTSSVNLVGTQTGGIVYLEVSEPLLDSLNQAIGGHSPDPSVRESEMADLAGELGNMIAGRIASGLTASGLCFTLSTPVVLRGRRGWRPEAEVGAGYRVSQSGWTGGGGQLILMSRIS